MRQARLMAGVMAILLITATMTDCKSAYGESKVKDPGVKTPAAMGRYVEKSIAMPKAVEEGKEFADQMIKNQGRLEIYSLSNNYKEEAQYCLKKDDTWERNIPNWLKQKDVKISKVTCSADGTRYVIGYTGQLKTVKAMVKLKILKINKNGDCQEIAIQDYAKKVPYVQLPYDIEVLADNRILLICGDRVSLYIDGKKKDSYKRSGNGYAVSSNQLLLINEKKDGVFIVDLNTGKKTSEIPCSGAIENNKFTADQQGNWYMVSRQGIQKLVKGRNQWKTIFDGSMGSMSKPKIFIETIIMGEKEDFYIMYRGENDKGELKHYTR